MHFHLFPVSSVILLLLFFLSEMVTCLIKSKLKGISVKSSNNYEMPHGVYRYLVFCLVSFLLLLILFLFLLLLFL